MTLGQPEQDIQHNGLYRDTASIPYQSTSGSVTYQEKLDKAREYQGKVSILGSAPTRTQTEEEEEANTPSGPPRIKFAIGDSSDKYEERTTSAPKEKPEGNRLGEHRDPSLPEQDYDIDYYREPEGITTTSVSIRRTRPNSSNTTTGIHYDNTGNGKEDDGWDGDDESVSAPLSSYGNWKDVQGNRYLDTTRRHNAIESNRIDALC